MVRKTDINGKLVQFAWWALATIVFTLVVVIRIRLLGIPLERDEGSRAIPSKLAALICFIIWMKAWIYGHDAAIVVVAA